MTRFSADSFPPIGVAAICAIALAISGQIGPRAPASNTPAANNQVAAADASARRIETQRVAASNPKQTWRPQPLPSSTLTRIGFGSCLRQTQPQPIWQAIVAAKPATFLMLGDNVYGDFSTPSGDKLERAYADLSAHPDFAKARAALPMLATWDDHDYGQNDGGADFDQKAVAERLFRQFWQGSGSLDGTRGPGIAYAHTFGETPRRVQIIMLDTRSFRSDLLRRPKNAPGKGKYMTDPDPTKTMLGAEQWQWLEARLREPAELRLIASSIQVVAQSHNFERWGNLPAERDKLFDMIDKTRAAGVIFLSGDRHRASFYREQRPGKTTIIEATSSALNASFRDPNEQGPHQLTPMLGRNNFGLIDIDWPARTVTLSLRDETGVAAEVLAVSFDPPKP